MRILLATRHPYLPQIAGGAQSSMHELTLELGARQHCVRVLAGLTGNGWLGVRDRVLLKLQNARAISDRTVGYDVYRAWHPETAVGEVTASFKPDVAVVQSGFPVTMAKAFLACGIPTVVYLRDVQTDQFGGNPSELRGCAIIANSQFTAGWYKEQYGLQANVVYPLFRSERYCTASTRTHVVFINPHPMKGLTIAIAMAEACPDIPFLFVESWTLGTTERQTLMQQIDRLANVTLIPSTNDMRQVYGKARLVLIPSQCEEAYGRVATEAQFSAIPVIASQIGGLPEAVGAGGILLAADAPVGDWVNAVRSVWFDDDLSTSLGAEARRHSIRPELDPNFQIEQIEAILKIAVEAHRS
jgi:glycosyltransferase involved in cell wall biosynthesis